MSRSDRGGMIRQHPARGLWEARYTAADGRRRSLYAKTRKEVQERLRTALTAVDQGIAPADTRTTVAAYLETWARLAAGSARRPPELPRDRQAVHRPGARSRPAGRADPGARRPDGRGPEQRGDLSPTTVRYALTVLRIALGRAVRSNRIPRNVATLVDAPAKADHELQPLTVEQVATFLDAIESDRLRALYVAAIGLGLRQGELLALRWQDVDLDAGTVTVRHTLTLDTRELAEPKTERARRTLRLPAEVHEALREHRRAQVEERLAVGRAMGRPRLRVRHAQRSAADGPERPASAAWAPEGGRAPPPALPRSTPRLRDACSWRMARSSASSRGPSGTPTSRRRRTSTRT